MTTERTTMQSEAFTIRWDELMRTYRVSVPNLPVPLKVVPYGSARLAVDQLNARLEIAEDLIERYAKGLNEIAYWDGRRTLGYEGPRDVARRTLSHDLERLSTPEIEHVLDGKEPGE